MRVQFKPSQIYITLKNITMSSKCNCYLKTPKGETPDHSKCGGVVNDFDKFIEGAEEALPPAKEIPNSPGFKELVEDHEDIGEPDFSKDSIALIAWNGENGLIIEHYGHHTELMIAEYGCSTFEEAMFESPPYEGLWIWTGRLYGGGVDRQGETEDVFLSGAYTPLETEDWDKLQHNKPIRDNANWYTVKEINPLNNGK